MATRNFNFKIQKQMPTFVSSLWFKLSNVITLKKSKRLYFIFNQNIIEQCFVSVFDDMNMYKHHWVD